MKLFCLVLGVTICACSSIAQSFADPEINPFGINPQGNRSSPAFADIDQDNDLDLFTGLVSGDFGFFENIGSNTFPSFGPLTLGPFGITSIGGNATPFFVDLDDDGDLDLFAGGDGGLRYYENIGNATVASFGPETQNPFSIAFNPTGISKPYLVDMDGDNDMDLFSGSSDGNTYYYENVGTANNPDFSDPVTNAFGLEDVGDRSAPSFIDIDGDGDFDLFIGNEDGDFHFYENTGNSQIPSFSFINLNPFSLQSVNADAKPTFGDLDDDGDMDLIAGNATGDYHYFENNTPPTGIPSFSNHALSVYPNPAIDHIRIQSNSTTFQDKRLVICDVAGNVVLSERIVNDVVEFDISWMESGLYHVSIYPVDAPSIHVKLIKLGKY